MHAPTPSISRCLELMDEFAMWENIRRHSFMVARVAEIVLGKLRNAPDCATAPARMLVIAGALLHDIAKAKCLNEGCRHSDEGAEICRELGYPEVAEVVSNHVILNSFQRERYERGKFSAIELVFYADKRVRHDEVVSLDARLEYILDKYAVNHPEYESRIRSTFMLCQELEEHLFSRLSIVPDEIAELICSVPADLAHYPPEATA